jgi:hypothetical protein
MSLPLVSAIADGLEFLSICADGTIITRHRQADGTVHWHCQHHVIFPGALILHGPLEAWRAKTLTLPPDACTRGNPSKIGVLTHTEHDRKIPFAFPLAPLSEEAAARILLALPDILLLVHDSTVSCRSDNDARYRAIE